MNKGEIIIYQTPDGTTNLDVRLEKETVWINRQQMTQLFDRDIKTVGKHINNALNYTNFQLSQNLRQLNSRKNSTCAEIAQVQSGGNGTLSILEYIGTKVQCAKNAHCNLK
jgi:hypothetical protein